MNTVAKTDEQPTPATIEDVLIRGDLSKLTEKDRTDYYLRVCHSVGLNPLTRPFDYLMLSGKLVLYAKRDAADQLRKLNGISVEIVSQKVADGLLTVHARAVDKTGRKDEDFGVVPFKGGGNEFAANLAMKAVTKAKRRVTLSISGLGFLDESEVGQGANDDEPEGSISAEQAAELTKEATELGLDKLKLLKSLGKRWSMELQSITAIPKSFFDDAKAQLKHWREKLEQDDAKGDAA
jgi:hypothetical protein